jgi:hypothetical protein
MSFSGRTGLPKPFNALKSKYNPAIQKLNAEKAKERANAPAYLRDEQSFKETTEKSFELTNPADV